MPDVRPGIYLHHSGYLYQVLFLAQDSENSRPSGRRMVVYTGLSLRGARPGPRCRVRPLAEFVEPVAWPDGMTRARFCWLGPELTQEMIESA